ncbi:MAG: hypothetical protein NTX50_29790 [Candidatus Sumerlaeota bacterium]|nr:hypothetical protein [Candidatus Sumerlaeota bacterium]
MKYLVVVDDQRESKASVAHWLAQNIADLTGGQYQGKTIEGVRIPLAFPRIADVRTEIIGQGDSLDGLVIDLAEKGDTKAGFRLAELVRTDSDLSRLPIVIYTGKYMEIDYAWAQRLKVIVIRRRATGGRGGELGAQILDAFGIQHS